MTLHLETPGSKLHVKDGMFEVAYINSNQLVCREQYAPAVVRSIWLHEQSTISVQAIQLAISNDVDIVTADYFGHPTGRFWPVKPNSTALIQKAQALVATRPEGLQMARQWVVMKLEGMARLLRDLKSRRDTVKQTMLEAVAVEILAFAQKMREVVIDTETFGGGCSGTAAATIRGIEGASTRAFFYALSQIIPERYHFTERSHRPAKDPFNAFLNYAYAILYNRIERSLVQAGLNPYVGFMHRDDYQFKAMVYDFIEPFRPGIVGAVFRLFSRKEINLAEDVFIADKESAVKITQLGKKKLTKVVTDYLDIEKLDLLVYTGRATTIITQMAGKTAQQITEIYHALLPLPQRTSKTLPLALA